MPEPRTVTYPASLICGCFLLLSGYSALAGDIWILVNTRASTLSVMEGDREKLVFEDIAIGRYGKTYFKKKGGITEADVLDLRGGENTGIAGLLTECGVPCKVDDVENDGRLVDDRGLVDDWGLVDHRRLVHGAYPPDRRA